jgi:hypothetical protein
VTQGLDRRVENNVIQKVYRRLVKILELHVYVGKFSLQKNLTAQGPTLCFLKIFSPKNSEKIGVLTQNKAKICKILIITLVFEKNANFIPAKNWQKSQKIVIITSTPGQAVSPGRGRRIVRSAPSG